MVYYKVAIKTTEALIDYFSNVINFSKPKLDVFSSYSYDGKRNFYYDCYEREGTVEEQIINYTFEKVSFYHDDLGNINGMRIYNYDLNAVVGEYPIDTATEARGLLLQNNYLTTVPAVKAKYLKELPKAEIHFS